MIQQNEARILLAKERNITVTGWMKTASMFKNKDACKTENSYLYNVQDDVLSARRTLNFVADYDAELVLLPVAGTVIYSDGCGNSAVIEAGKMQYFSLKQNIPVKIFNAYDEEYVNFLRIWLKPGSIGSIISTACFSFERESNKNKLLHLFAGLNNEQQPLKFFIGKFDGRKEALLKISQPGNMFFVFVIDGAFEVQYRLLETRDALFLWNTDDVGLEALSNDAVILIAELPAA